MLFLIIAVVLMDVLLFITHRKQVQTLHDKIAVLEDQLVATQAAQKSRGRRD